MRDSADAFTVFGWGLRRYLWLVGLLVLVLGALVPVTLDRSPAVYEASAQVGPADQLSIPNLDALPRLGTSLFNNGGVAEAVRHTVRPALDPSEDVIPDRAELIAAQDNIVFTVIGRGPTAQAAQSAANAAATRFTQELNKYSDSVGSFALQDLATPPSAPVPHLGALPAVGVGVLAGLLAGLGAIALLLVLRRPLIDLPAASRATGQPALGSVHLASTVEGMRGLPQLCGRIRDLGVDEVLLTGPRSNARARRRLAFGLNQALGFPVVDDASPLDVATRPAGTLVLLAVRKGIAESSARRLAEQFLDDDRAGVVLVTGAAGRVGDSWLDRVPRLRTRESRAFASDE